MINMYDIIIIGAGPAGMTAALYALRANKKVLILEAKSYGGRIITTNKIENYPGMPNVSGFDFATALYEQVKSFGGEFKFETVIKIDKEKKVYTDSDIYEGKAIILAIGVDNRKLGIDRELEFVGKGISYCATCDGNFYKDKPVAVVGGGETAIGDAIYLSDIASKVYLIHRSENFKATNINVEKVIETPNIEIYTNYVISKLNGEDKINSITIKNNNEEKTLDVNGLFIAVGEEPRNEIFADIIKLDKNGYIISQDGVHTNIDGIYVAGDARVKDLRQLTTAVADGSIAATVAMREMK